MLDDFLDKKVVDVCENRDQQILDIEENTEVEIKTINYVGSLIKGFKKFYEKGSSEEAIYSDIGNVMNKIYQTYDYKDEVLLDNAKNYRERSEIENGGVLLGLEKISGDPNVLDGAFDTGEILSLTTKGKEILDGYRLAKGELTLEDERRDLHRRFREKSYYLCRR